MEGFDGAGRIAQVLLPLPLPEAFDYAEPEGMELAVGDIVAVPLGPRTIGGVVVGLRGALGVNRPLRAVSGWLEAPRLPEKTLEFLQWAAKYAVDAPGQPLAIALRGLRGAVPRPRFGLIATGLAPARPTPARLKVLAAAVEPLAPAALARAAGVSAGVLKPLIAEGCLETVMTTTRSTLAAPDPGLPGASLNPSQAAAAHALCAMLRPGAFAAALLDGVTGSGKTEVYLEVVAHALRRDPAAQVLVLLPEIALTHAVIDRFEKRFGAAPVEWHSGVSSPRRRASFEAVASGEARIVVGARSALFLPFKRLALIIVDEEHDNAYKQEDGFIYHARDLAVTRGRIEGCAVVLASATPSLETLSNAQSGRYAWLRLADRHGGAGMPRVELIDLRLTPPAPGAWLSPPLIEAMTSALKAGEQTLLFLNRRGYAPLVLCRVCGERLKAPDTDSWLVEHRYTGRLVCHLTGFSMPKPKACPHCGAVGSLVSIGPGVERVEEEARLLFPEARLAVFSSDTTADPAAARQLIADMAAGSYDIMVATQSAAKGHDFPGLALVGVVDADLGLRGGDLRAAERTYQLLHQVGGRAGRAERPGRVLIQTYMPEQPVMRALAADDRDRFLEAEAAQRRDAHLPPFARLAALIVSAPDAEAADFAARALARAAPHMPGVTVLGPAPAPLAILRGRHRRRLLLQAERGVNVQAVLREWLGKVRLAGATRLQVDIDPYSFL